MKLKHLFVVSLILIILTIGAASASQDIDSSQGVGDISDKTVFDTKDNPETLQSDESQMKDNLNERLVDENTLNAPYHINGGTFDQIQEIIDTCDDGSIIELEGVFNSTGTPIKINKNLEIKGTPGTVLDAKGFNSILSFVDNKNCLISGITFINANPIEYDIMNYVIFENYGNYGNYSIFNCTFRNNNRVEIIFLQNENTNCKIVNCNFLDNTGNIQINGNISNCNFERCSNGMVRASYILDSNFIKNSNFIIFHPNAVINSKFSKNTINEYSYHLINTAQSVLDCNFIDNSGIGFGLIYDINLVKNCNFENNVVDMYEDYASMGGAIYNVVSVDSCNFTKCRACYGGAINLVDSVTNCIFKENVGNYGAGAIYDAHHISKSSFINNKALKYSSGAVLMASTDSFSIVGCDFIGNNAKKSGGAISALSNGQIDGCTFTNNKAGASGSAIEISTESNSVKIDLSNTIFSNNIADGKFYTYGYDFKNYGNGAIFVLGNNKHKLTFTNCRGIEKNTDKFKININVKVPKSVKYKTYLVITVKDQFSVAVPGEKISVNFDGNKYKKVTDKNGQIKILINSPLKSYSVKISHNGNDDVAKFSKTVKVKVKKAEPKFSTNTQSFKSKVKTKKLTVTLEDISPVKNAKISLKINGKTYTAKTSSKGKATFKITKLSKKGTYKAKLKFDGDKYYNKCSKTLKITVN
ncbi:hypothetical protein [uncultured Methanobrevibacter sp.]|uniref:hypothetical protein n=1 Tax=uncultured Methanobrevibacter sp. TaxID=253161 RepID=UPI0025D7B041|nr:hypothetical protein [uncultured Methanobrevibacter sp.]